MANDDGYGKSWSYRVLSQMWTEPDVPESGQRYLSPGLSEVISSRPASHAACDIGGSAHLDRDNRPSMLASEY